MDQRSHCLQTTQIHSYAVRTPVNTLLTQVGSILTAREDSRSRMLENVLHDGRITFEQGELLNKPVSLQDYENILFSHQ